VRYFFVRLREGRLPRAASPSGAGSRYFLIQVRQSLSLPIKTSAAIIERMTSSWQGFVMDDVIPAE